MITKEEKMSFVFFGTSRIAVLVLDKLREANLIPSLIVTQPDKPKGRGLTVTPTPVKEWAIKNRVRYDCPMKLQDANFVDELSSGKYDCFVLVSYGKIIPKSIIDIAGRGIVNLHPSLLPKLRGPSPIESTILNDMKDDAGVTIMKIDSKMDHGPIIAQRKVDLLNWPVRKTELEEIFGRVGGELLAESLPKWLRGELPEIDQDESRATYCKLISKDDALINLDDNPYDNFLKICAYSEWPVAFFLTEHRGAQIRVKITQARFEHENLVIQKVIPEGKKEMGYEEFLRGLK